MALTPQEIKERAENREVEMSELNREKSGKTKSNRENRLADEDSS